ncbi:hypothetical protein [Vibrio alginolyticus]|uniref:hypothetical protein n=1 Tax=Vibrio alginolyticus TaxID=663 RepID=UPI001BD5198C|nr:hypothetical protein [Vibrio alginolyticus]MBT0091824.1 hypothetical protein [Vibrio alginolyticus]
MITNIEFPPAEALAPLRDEALEGTTAEAWLNKQLTAISTLLQKNPQSYRSYGPYWWAVKSLLKEKGFDYGEDDEAITREHFNYDDPVDLMCAAWAYQQHIMDMQMLGYNIHPFTIDDEPFDYSIEDTDLEAMKYLA